MINSIIFLYFFIEKINYSYINIVGLKNEFTSVIVDAVTYQTIYEIILPNIIINHIYNICVILFIVVVCHL